MACGNNSVSRAMLQSPAQPLRHPVAARPGESRASVGGREVPAAHHLLEEAARDLDRARGRVQRATTAADVAVGLREATASIAKARRIGNRVQTAKIERQLAELVRTSEARTSVIETDERMRGMLARAVLDAQNDRLSPRNLGVSLLVKAGSILDTVGDVAHLLEETVSIGTVILSSGSGPVPASPLVSSPADSSISRPADTSEGPPSVSSDDRQDAKRDDGLSDGIDDWTNAKDAELDAASRRRPDESEEDERQGTRDR